MTARDLQQRRADALDHLLSDRDVWIATASPDGVPHLVPVSLCWFENHVVVAVPRSSKTAKNVGTTKRARLALGDPRDVVVIEAEGETVDPEGDGSGRLLDAFQLRTGWDTQAEPGDYVLLRFTPKRIQAWRNVAEIRGREIMRDGQWLT